MMPNFPQNHVAAIAFRGSISAVFALWAFAAGAQAQPAQAAKAASIDGVYNGTYAGAQWPIKFKLSLTQQDNRNRVLAGSCTLYLPEGDGTKEYTCDVRGVYIPANRMVQVLRGKWETPPPAGVDMPGMTGLFDPEGGNGAGQIAGTVLVRHGPQFQAIRDADESAKMADAAAAKKAAGAAPVAPPARPAAAAHPATPAPSSPPASSSPPPAPSSPQRPAAAPAPNTVSPTAINGAYTGEWRRPEGNSKLKLSIVSTEDGSLTALFTFDPPNRRIGPSITFKLTGRYNPGAKDRWGNRQDPFQFTTIEPMGNGAQKALDASKAQAARVGITSPGSITGVLFRSDPQSGESNGGQFSATKDRTQPPDLDQTMVAQAGATTVPVVRLPFEGVYNGTYASDRLPTTKFKLQLWLQQEHKTAAGEIVQTDIAGLLTVFPSDSSGTLPCTCELRGFYGNTSMAIQLTSRGWEPRIPSIPLMTGLQGKFDPNGGGAAQISGGMMQPSNPAFQATKDAAESASMDIERLRNHIYPRIVGVFNGTYTRQNEAPTKFKLTIKHNGDGPAGLEGIATIYLPSGSGTKPYTYDLKGVETSHGEFQLLVHDWVSAPPSDFKNFRAMGFNGKVIVNDAVTTAKMSSVPPASSMAEFYLPQFEATWDTTESADRNAAIIAQKSVGDVEQAAALKARDEMIKNAPPKELASKGLVRKSRQYWDAYQHDMIREVFDGGFGAAMEENREFQKVFCTYVEMFSAKCPDCLPPDHVRVTNIVRTNRKFDKQTGFLINEENHDYTVDMDPRFEEGYKRCWAAVNSKGAELAGVMAAAQPGGARRVLGDLMTLATDMQRFFAEHGGKSAAMRQMTENFVRAVNGDPSLQQAGGKIDGAEAESDKDLPPGKYARFVDGANAYFREKAKRGPSYLGNSASHDTALCQRMAELLELYMKPDEEYYYANDFAGRFLPIMGPRASCPDPAWPTIHPDVEKAIAEVK
jgi:hypothetical protein